MRFVAKQSEMFTKCFLRCTLTADAIFRRRHFRKMAAAKPEVHTAAVVCEIESKFQIYFRGIQGCSTQWKCLDCYLTCLLEHHVTPDNTSGLAAAIL